MAHFRLLTKLQLDAIIMIFLHFRSKEINPIDHSQNFLIRKERVSIYER